MLLELGWVEYMVMAYTFVSREVFVLVHHIDADAMANIDGNLD